MRYFTPCRSLAHERLSEAVDKLGGMLVSGEGEEGDACAMGLLEEFRELDK